jgi:hypothetical protein
MLVVCIHLEDECLLQGCSCFFQNRIEQVGFANASSAGNAHDLQTRF